MVKLTMGIYMLVIPGQTNNGYMLVIPGQTNNGYMLVIPGQSQTVSQVRCMWHTQ